MATQTSNPKDRNLLAVIGDEDSVTGLLLAGIGHIDNNQSKNFLIVDPSEWPVPLMCARQLIAETQTSVIESAFQDFTERKDIAILLINQHVAERIRPTVDRYQAAFPALLEIPSKEHPYDPAKDSVLKRVQKLRGD